MRVYVGATYTVESAHVGDNVCSSVSVDVPFMLVCVLCVFVFTWADKLMAFVSLRDLIIPAKDRSRLLPPFYPYATICVGELVLASNQSQRSCSKRCLSGSVCLALSRCFSLSLALLEMNWCDSAHLAIDLSQAGISRFLPVVCLLPFAQRNADWGDLITLFRPQLLIRLRRILCDA